MNYLSIFTQGVTIATGAVSATIGIPTVSGLLPRYVRIVATAAAYVRVSPAGSATAVVGDILVQPGDAVILCVAGCTNVSAIQVTAAGVVQVSPVDNM